MVRVTETPALRPPLEPSDPEELAEFAALLPSGVAGHANLALAGSPSGVGKSIRKVRTEAAGFLFFDSGVHPAGVEPAKLHANLTGGTQRVLWLKRRIPPGLLLYSDRLCQVGPAI